MLAPAKQANMDAKSLPGQYPHGAAVVSGKANSGVMRISSTPTFPRNGDAINYITPPPDGAKGSHAAGAVSGPPVWSAETAPPCLGPSTWNSSTSAP